MHSLLLIISIEAASFLPSDDPLVTAAQHQVREWYCNVPKPEKIVEGLLVKKLEQNPNWIQDRLTYEYQSAVRQIERSFMRPYDAMQFCTEMERVLK